jgi:TRAP-type C4-dicarboxylate transport system permease small subunit
MRAAGDNGASAVTGARYVALDRTLAWLTELPAAALLVVEVFVLFIGVTSRYVFDRPTVWSDPLASVLFLWLAMLGAVVGLRRNKHMCLHAVEIGRAHV